MSKTVQTTLGPLPVEKLGDYIDAHEHLFMDSSNAIKEIPDFKLDNVEGAIRDVTDWKRAGGGAMVDTCPVGTGRNVRKCIDVSKETGIPIIISSGFHKDMFYWPDHWRYSYSEDQMVELIAAECEIGVDLNEYKGPIVERSTVKAGALKVAGLYNCISPNMRSLIKVVGRVHQRTGTPVYAHTERGFEPFEIVDCLEQAGVPARSILICHMDRNPDLYLHKKLAARGVNLEYDTPSRFKYLPECSVVKLMRQMIDAGFGDRLMLGGDFARRSYLKSYGGGPGYDYLLTWFTPRLREEGFSNAELTAIWRDNPIRWLTAGLK
jgi:5-phospho-D-xylono-1,4-lactonase